MAFTVVLDKATGDRFLEADWDSYIRDNINFLAVPPRALLHLDTSQAITTGATGEAIAFTDESFDTAALGDIAGQPTRITFAVAGSYLIVAQIRFAADATGTLRRAWLLKNGTDIIGDAQVHPGAAYTSMHVMGLNQFSAVTDYVQLWVAHDVGSDLNVEGDASGVYTWMSVHWQGNFS